MFKKHALQVHLVKAPKSPDDPIQNPLNITTDEQLVLFVERQVKQLLIGIAGTVIAVAVVNVVGDIVIARIETD